MTADSDYVLTPQGRRHRSLVHHIVDGARLSKTPTSWRYLSASGALLTEVQAPALPVEVRGVPLPKPVPDSGWVSYSDWRNVSATPVSFFETTWTVPPAPASESGQTVFLFNALQDAAGTHILQPVLQWGASAAIGSSNIWAVASWWVGGETDPCFITSLIPVSVGTTLVGRITLVPQTNGLFGYTCEFVGVAGTALTAENLPELSDCTETLEVYGVTSPADYPATAKTAFSGIRLQTGSVAAPLQWAAKGTTPPTIVSQSATAGEVDITYPQQP